jgi:thiamine kinase-like enzyme
MHRSGQTFEFRFELFAMIDDYLKVLAKLGATLPEGYHAVVGEAEKVRVALDSHPVALAPCHCDPLTENFLDDGDRMWVVDWEYSGMNDPIWDLGDMSVEAGLDEALDLEMMEAYCEGRVPRALHGRMVIYKAMCDLLWTLWGLIQHANQNPVDDFWAYAVKRFERCKVLMGAADFGRHLDAIARNSA